MHCIHMYVHAYKRGECVCESVYGSTKMCGGILHVHVYTVHTRKPMG